MMDGYNDVVWREQGKESLHVSHIVLSLVIPLLKKTKRQIPTKLEIINLI